MPGVFTEKEYPVEDNWILKTPVNFLLATFILIFMIVPFLLPLLFESDEAVFAIAAVVGMIFISMLVLGVLATIVAFLSRDNFHYSIDDEFMIFQQGIISKQQKNLPYGVIQDLILSQDITDRLFDLASLTIENASFSGGQVVARSGGGRAMIGFMANTAVIPGLTKQNAETLKNILLAKMKEFSNKSSGSGL
jgi:uncharacterized membrane protein YdbT with pleckstrin-like domain